MPTGPHRRSRDDRHGRMLAPDTDRARRPSGGYRARSERRFGELVTEALGAVPDRVAAALAGAEVAVEALPPADMGGEVPLAHFETAGPDNRARLTVYRRPVEGRADSRSHLVELVELGVTRAVAHVLGLGDLDDFDE